MEAQISRSDELAHYGILGQKWGVRRYQNPDGSYTEEGIKRYQKKYPYQNPDGSLTERGRKEYMKAARKGQLDYKHLSDKDLDMINNRFNKENQYKRNVEEYEKSTFKYRAKEAAISRIKGNGGGGGKGKGKGGNGIGKLLMTPIKKAFEDAFKDDGKDNDDNNMTPEDKWWNNAKKRKAFVSNYDANDAKFNADVERGKKAFMDDVNNWKDFDNSSRRSSEDVLRDRNRKERPTDYGQDRRPRNLRGLPSGGIYMDSSEYSIHYDADSVVIIHRDLKDE